MIDIKSKEEIEVMRQGGRILAQTLFTLIDQIRPGVSELDLDKLAEELILKAGAEPAFKKVKDYKNTICVSTNDVVVHGVPTDYKFQEGDVVGIDCGVYYNGLNTDMAETLRVSTQNSTHSTSSGLMLSEVEASKLKSQKSEEEIEKFLKTGMVALEKGINAAILGNRVGHISKAIQDVVEKEGYSMVRSLVGHGVGVSLHEEPEVPGFLDKPISKTPRIRAGMTLAIEVIYNMGKSEVVYSNSDGWTIKTNDNSLSGLFERTVAITPDGPIILTQV